MKSHYPGFGADLALVVVRTGHARYRELTDPAHPDYRAGYVGVVRREAARLRGEPAPPVPRAGKPRFKDLDEQIRATRDCPDCHAAAEAAARARREKAG